MKQDDKYTNSYKTLKHIRRSSRGRNVKKDDDFIYVYTVNKKNVALMLQYGQIGPYFHEY